MERSLRADDGPAQRALRQACTVPGAEPRIVSLTFEQILWDPRTVSLALCAFLALDIPDAGAIDAMANCVVPRTPECLPGFLEAELILSGQAGAGKLH